MILKEHYTLTNGVQIPKLGLGTWFINSKNAVTAVAEALQLGYRHIDTAQAYRNEKGVGAGIQKSGVAREAIFVTTKLAAGIKSYTKAVKAIDKSLQALGLDYIDMLLIHSPQPWTKFRGEDRYFEGNTAVWKAMEEAYRVGKLRAIGVSNFEIPDLENLMNTGTVVPMVNQVLAHIGTIPNELIAFCNRHEILVEAYSPIAHGMLLEHKAVVALAEKYKVSVPQLSLQYLLQLGLLPLPKTANPKHMQSNAALDFTIAAADMQVLHQVATITDYGSASVMPVYGGQLNFSGILKMIMSSFKK